MRDEGSIYTAEALGQLALAVSCTQDRKEAVVLGLEKLAAWWDEQKGHSEHALDEFIHKHPNWFGVVVAGTVQSAMDLGGGFVDVLRLGEGVKEGGWGYGKDALRLVAVAGPLARVGRFALARVTPNPSGGVCAWVASAKALRQTGTRHFATVGELMQAAGHSQAPTTMSQMMGVLRSLGARVRNLGKVGSMADLKRLVASHPNDVVLFGVSWKAGGHALYAFRDALGRFRIADRTGVVASSLAELEQLVLKKLGSTYSGISGATLQGAAVLVEKSAIIHGVNLASIVSLGANLANILGLEVRSVMLVDRKAADLEMDRIRATQPAPQRPPPAPMGSATHMVIVGETLSQIAQFYYGKDKAYLWRSIYDANKAVIGSNPNLIRPGQRLLIPGAKKMLHGIPIPPLG